MQQLAIIYSSPALSMLFEGSGYVRMQYGYWLSNDKHQMKELKQILKPLKMH